MASSATYVCDFLYTSNGEKKTFTYSIIPIAMLHKPPLHIQIYLAILLYYVVFVVVVVVVIVVVLCSLYGCSADCMRTRLVM